MLRHRTCAHIGKRMCWSAGVQGPENNFFFIITRIISFLLHSLWGLSIIYIKQKIIHLIIFIINHLKGQIADEWKSFSIVIGRGTA
jgi:hypothetical protein